MSEWAGHGPDSLSLDEAALARWWMAWAKTAAGEPVCDYCDEGNIPENGWHYYPATEYDPGYRVPCARS